MNISYLTYAGGFDIGFAAAGLEPHYHLHDGYAQKTYAMNWPDVAMDYWSDRKISYGAPVDLLIANPPCACWSVNSKQLGTSDPRIKDTYRLIDLAKEYNPKILITESVVPAMKFFEGEFSDRFTELGYSVTILLVNTMWHRVPQDRKRMFFIASKIGIDIPPPNYAPPMVVKEALEGVQVDLAIDQEATRPMERRAFDGRLADIEPGESLAKAWARLIGGPDESQWKRNSRGHVIGRPPFCSYKLNPDTPARTFTGYYAYCYEDRWLTLREIKDNICQFPEDYKFHKQHIGEQMKEMSRGVMPYMAQWLGVHINNALALNSRTLTIRNEVIDYRLPPL